MPHADTDTGAVTPRTDWRLVVWLPVVFAVAAVRWLRWHLCGAAYRIGDALNDAPPMTDARVDALNGRIARAVAAEAARERGGAT